MHLQENGFTLIEILTTITISIILMSISSISYIYFSRKTDLDKTTYDIITTIQTAQAKTLSSEDSFQYGVHFENDKYVLFKGNSYLAGDPNNKEYSLPDRIEIYNINLTGSGSEVIFQKISGKTDQNGTIGLRIILEPSNEKTITITSLGNTELESSGIICCNTNRITDTRHLNLTLGWTIQGATTLTLNFPDTTEVNTDIDMTNYFNVGQTEFNWSDTIDVNGQNQELIIHTVFLDATNTILSIHRDQDNNNKPLEILIDAKDIISYTANGDATIESFGGIAEAQ
ncbi:prepilin-type N-terminal cleavage/methylation domain-containing protein [Patescibacteria group bacterium]